VDDLLHPLDQSLLLTGDWPQAIDTF